MALVVAATFAFCLWIVLFALGQKSFDGFFLALCIIALVAGTRILTSRIRRDNQID